MTTTQPAARTGNDAQTPTPWHVEEQTNSVGQLLYFSVEHPDGPYRGTVCNVFPAEHIGGITESEARANAAFIVRACNSHAALVEALGRCLDSMIFEYPNGMPAQLTRHSDWNNAVSSARTALAAANGGQP